MAYKILLLVLVFGLVSIESESQTYSPHRTYPHQELNIHSPDNELFNKEEIKIKGYTEAFIVNTFGTRNADGDAQFSDTLFGYKFDTSGRTIQKITFNNYSPRDTFNLQNPKKEHSAYVESRTTLNDSMELIYSIDTGSGIPDTLFLRIETLDKRGRIKEISRKPTKSMLRFECATGTAFHFKYDYDEDDQIIYFRNFRYPTYDSISYNKYGYELRTFEVNSDSLLSEEFILVNRTEETESVIGNSEQVIRSYEGKLLKMLAIVDMGYSPSIRYYEIYYR